MPKHYIAAYNKGCWLGVALCRFHPGWFYRCSQREINARGGLAIDLQQLDAGLAMV